MTERHIDKTCNDCKCRKCDPITEMAERLDAYKSAQSLIKDMAWPEDVWPSPREVLVLANWLYYGAGEAEEG